MATIYEKLMNIQAELKVPKSQYSEFGSYHYRSCEEILEELKPLLVKNKATLIINDEIMQVGDRYYVKAIAKLIDIEKGESIETTSYARESETKTKMDIAQITGSTSSYARKYALNGLFAIDDTKDEDYLNDKQKKVNAKTNKSNNQSKPSQNNLASENQLNLIYKLSAEKNYSKESMSNYIKTMYKKSKSNELTKSEASDLITMLQKLEKK